MQLTAQQKRYFETFGFLKFPGLFAMEIQALIDEFERVFEANPGLGINGITKHPCIVPFIDQSAMLSRLLDDPRIDGIASGVLGDDFNYVAGDGDLYGGDTQWHSDGSFQPHLRFIKMAFYLEPLTVATGALRVIPGSHRAGEGFAEAAQAVCASRDHLGIDGSEVPSVALETRPGDLVVFDHRLKHASFGGGTRRRMFTLNLCEHAKTKKQIDVLRTYIRSHAQWWMTSTFGPEMLKPENESRMRHLRQPLELQGDMADRAIEHMRKCAEAPDSSDPLLMRRKAEARRRLAALEVTEVR
ncbi:MAG TPA: phytanoyl-CoA dioxygenase family protein [Planctomycetota bacterium]|nr:phytanoyl-CoA dioxygenase family protein [Planctomycetota bacterium]